MEMMKERLYKIIPETSPIGITGLLDEIELFVEKEVSRREREIVEIVIEKTPGHMTRNYNSTDQMRDSIIARITGGTAAEEQV